MAGGARLPALLVTAVVLFALVACGKSTTTTTNASGQVVTTCHINFARTKFVLHAGLAAGAFHRYIYKPYRAGAFKQGAPGRRKALAKAGASALFASHQLKLAADDARCDGATLQKLASPLAAAVAAVSSLRGALGGGSLGGIADAATAVDGLVGRAGQAGVQISDR